MTTTDHLREARWRHAVDHDDLYHRTRGAIHEANLEQVELRKEVDMADDALQQMSAHWDEVREQRDELRAQLDRAENLLKAAGIGLTELDTTETRWETLKLALAHARKSHDLDMLCRLVQKEFDRAELVLGQLVHARSDWARVQDENRRLKAEQ